MTVLMGIVCKDGLIMASDKLRMHEQKGIREEAQKLYYSRNMPLAMGYRGSAYNSQWNVMGQTLAEKYKRATIEELIGRDIPEFNVGINKYLIERSRQVDFFGVFSIPLLHL